MIVDERRYRKVMTMLVADDPIQIGYISDLLQKNGFEVIAFDRPHDAISAAQQENEIELVIADFRTPDIDELEFIETIRKLCPGIPVIMLAAHATVEDYIKALGLGVWELIHKPANDAEVIRIMKVIVSKTDNHISYCKAKQLPM